VELDVLLCATGEVVVFHDDDLARLAGRPERVADLPLAELRRVTLTRGGSIPTLEEAFEACGPELLVNVELKTSGLADRGVPALVEAVGRVLDRTQTAGRVLVSSFSPIAVAWWRLRRPAVAAGLLFERAAPLPLRRGWSARLIRPLAVHPEVVLCDAGAIQRWHDAGYAVNTWTVDDPARLRELAAAGIDGVIANDPRAAREAIGTAGR
jgi:glycerophosphoryl diester phosphodiesterase